MRLVKKHTDAFAGVLEDEEVRHIKSAISEDTVRGWSVFDPDGIELMSEGVSETVTAVCSNVLDLAMAVGRELDDQAPRPSITFLKGSKELQTEPMARANILIVRDKAAGGFRKGV